MKRLLNFVLALSVILGVLSGMELYVIANETTVVSSNAISIGDCITLGNYNGEPIVWRCVDIDENGPLMLSENVLCIKAYDASGTDSVYHTDGWSSTVRKRSGSNCWEDSNLRQWLNCNSTSVPWTHCPPIASELSPGNYPYADEAGFLTNFTAFELNLIKSTSHLVNVNIWETSRAGYCDGGSSDTIANVITISSLNCKNYYYKYITDSMFVLSAYQYNRIYCNNPQYLTAYPTKTLAENASLSEGKAMSYWTNIPGGNNYACYDMTYYINGTSTFAWSTTKQDWCGVRPAFYLDVDKYVAAMNTPSIAVFSTEKSLSVETGNSLWLGFGLMNKSGLIDENWKKMAVTVSDPTVISLSEYTETEYGYSLELNGLKQGATNIVVTDTETGANTILQISVYDKYARTYSYDIENMKTFYPNNDFEKHLQTNIYNLSGMYVNNYSCTKSGTEYNVTFDVYNSRYYSGAVDVYDANGDWVRCYEIEKFEDIQSLWDTGEQAWYLISNVAAYIPGGNNSSLFTYEQESTSKHTPISITVPESGYFTISNNIMESPGTMMLNATEIVFDAACTWSDVAAFIAGDALKEAKKNFKKAIMDELFATPEIRKALMDTFRETVANDLQSVTQKALQGYTETACADMATIYENILSKLNIKWKDTFESIVGVGQGILTQFFGPAGVVLNGMFLVNEKIDGTYQIIQFLKSSDNSYATVYSVISEGEINPQGVIINTEGNMDVEAVLQVFRVSNSDTIDVVLDSENPLEKHELYNICFVKNDQEVQPSGKVKVHMPIPQGMKSDTVMIYRQESDGSWTVLDAHVEGNYMVFETDHFSMYAVVGDMETLTVSSMPNVIQYIEGDVLETKGLVLQIGETVIESGYYCDSMVIYQLGKQTITVKYGNTETTFDVEVFKRIMGDITRDATLDTTDVRLALLKIVGLIEDFTEKETAITDMNEDGKVNSADVRLMMVSIVSNEAMLE